MVLQYFCPICMEEYDTADQLSSTRCGHVFHTKCLREWLSRSSSCPLCTGHSPINDISNVYITSRSYELEKQLLQENLKLKSELEQSIKSLSECENKFDECESNFMRMLVLFNLVMNDIQETVDSLEQKLITIKQENENSEESVDAVQSQVASPCTSSLTNKNNDSNIMPLTTNSANFDINENLTVRERAIYNLVNMIRNGQLSK